MVNDTIRRSIEYAYNHKDEALSFCKKYAQDMDNNVMDSHIKLYVNEYSKDLSPAIMAVSTLIGADKSVFV